MRFDTFHRRLLNKDAECVAMAAVMARSGVHAPKSEMDAIYMPPGATYATGAIRKVLSEYGPEVAVAVLSALRFSVPPGEIRADSILALSEVVRVCPGWISPLQRFAEAVNKVDIPSVREQARKYQKGAGLSKTMIPLLIHDLSQILGAGRYNGSVKSRVERHTHSPS